MKIAIILSGNVRTWSNDTQKSFIKTFLCLKPDIFVYTEKLKYNYHSYIKAQKGIESDEIISCISDIKFDESLYPFIKDFKIDDMNYNYNEIKESGIVDSFKLNDNMKEFYHGFFQYMKFQRGIEMMKEYENNTGIKYDVVIKVRFDNYYKDINIENIINVIKDDEHNVILQDNRYIGLFPNDYIFIGKRDDICLVPLSILLEYKQPSSPLSYKNPPHGLLENVLSRNKMNVILADICSIKYL